jgi:hypothetical protein
MTARISLTRLGLSLLLVLSASGLCTTARADSSSNTRAARLTYMQGTVTVSEADNPTGVPAQMNLPLLSGVQIATGDDGQAEIEFEDGSVVRLTPNSALFLENLTVQPDGVFMSHLSLLHGLAYCELRATPQYRYAVNAGGDVLSPVENTTVRIDFDEPPAIFSVLDGTAQVERQNGQYAESANSGYQTQVRAGETLRADPSDANRYFLTQQIADDSWDQWNEDRDQEATSEAANSTPVRNDYAGAQGYGWSDLDANGDWYDVPGQGPVWQPQVAAGDAGFDPYDNGEWIWYPSTGYLWASSYSWGWTPYRCGNWSYFNGFGWGWAPGSGCGGFGWGFAGGGRPVNVVLGPTGYRPVRVPLAVNGHPTSPILRMHPVKAWDASTPPNGDQAGQRRGDRGDQSGQRTIDGVAVAPIRPVGRKPDGNDNHVSSALRRDFPIDSTSRAPVLGAVSTSPIVVHPTSALRTNQARPYNPEVPAAEQPQQAPYTRNAGQSYPSGGQYRGAHEAAPTQPSNQGQPNQGQRQEQQTRPTERNSFRPVPPPANPNPQPAHPTYTQPPAPAPHPTYNPPPQPAPAPHPTYTPPPSPPPSAPPPAPAPHQNTEPARSRPN